MVPRQRIRHLTPPPPSFSRRRTLQTDRQLVDSITRKQFEALLTNWGGRPAAAKLQDMQAAICDESFIGLECCVCTCSDGNSSPFFQMFATSGLVAGGPNRISAAAYFPGTASLTTRSRPGTRLWAALHGVSTSPYQRQPRCFISAAPRGAFLRRQLTKSPGKKSGSEDPTFEKNNVARDAAVGSPDTMPPMLELAAILRIFPEVVKQWVSHSHHGFNLLRHMLSVGEHALYVHLAVRGCVVIQPRASH